MKLNIKLLTARLTGFLAVFIMSFTTLSLFEATFSSPAGKFAHAATTGLNWQTPPVVVGPSSPEPQRLLNLTIQKRPTDGVGFLVGETGSGSANQAAGGLLYLKTNASWNGLASSFVSVNDAATNTNKFPKLAFAGDGSGMFVWRNFDETAGYRAYARRILPTEQLAPGFDLGNMYAASGGSAVLDMPAIAWGASAGKFYLTGQVQTVPPGWGFAEMGTDGSLAGVTTVMANRPATGNNIRPELCVDGTGNVHMVGGWGYDVVAISRVGGVWQSALTPLSNSSANGDYSYRGSLSITCTSDGYAYAVWEAVRSFGIARFNPPGNALGAPAGWQVLSQDVWASSANDSTFASVTTTPDSKVWVALSLNSSTGGAGTYVLVSSDRGQSFSNQSEADKPITSGAISGNGLVYSQANNRFGLATTHADPYVSYWTNTTNPVIPPTLAPTATATQVVPTATVTPTRTVTATASPTSTRSATATATVSPSPTSTATAPTTASPTVATTASPTATLTPTPTRTATATATTNASGTATALAVMRAQLTADAGAAYATITALAKSKPTQPPITTLPATTVPVVPQATSAPALPTATATPRPTNTVKAIATPTKAVSNGVATTSVAAPATSTPVPTASPLPALVIGYGPATNGSGSSLASNAGSNTGLLNLPALGIALPTVTPVPATATPTPEPATPTPPIGAADTGGESLSLVVTANNVSAFFNAAKEQTPVNISIGIKLGLSLVIAFAVLAGWHWFRRIFSKRTRRLT